MISCEQLSSIFFSAGCFSENEKNMTALTFVIYGLVPLCCRHNEGTSCLDDLFHATTRLPVNFLIYIELI